VWVTCCATADPGDGAGEAVAPALEGLPVVAGLAGPSAVCYCRRAVEEFRVEVPAGADGVVACVTCGVAPPEDTQCRGCREARQRDSRARFAARQTRLGRPSRRR